MLRRKLTALSAPFKVLTETALQCGEEYRNVWQRITVRQCALHIRVSDSLWDI